MGRVHTIDMNPVDEAIYDVSDSSIYGLPTSKPAITRRGSVTRYVSFSPEGRFTFRIAWPTCFTIHIIPSFSKIFL